MVEEQDIQAEIKKVSEAIRSLENLRGKIPEEQLQASLSAYQKRLQMLVVKLKSAGPSTTSVTPMRRQQLITEEDETGRTPLTGSAQRDGLALYRAAPGDARLDEDTFKRLLGQYLAWVRTAYGSVRLFGLETIHEDGAKFLRPLNEMYQKPVLRIFGGKQHEEAMNQAVGKTTRAARARRHLDAVDRVRSEGKELPFDEVITTGKRLALLGGAGSGKTTLLAYLAVSLAANAQNNSLVPFSLPKDCSTLIPFLIPLRYYWKFRKEKEQEQQRKQKEEARQRAEQEAAKKANPAAKQEDPQTPEPTPAKKETDSQEGTLAGFVLSYLKQIHPAFRFSEDFFERLLKSGKCLLLLDGLDEYSSGLLRSDARRQLQLLLNAFPDNWVVVSARDSGCLEDAFFDESFKLVHIIPFPPEEMDKFVLNWCNQFNPRKAGSLRRDIWSAVEDLNQVCTQHRLPPLVETPLMGQMVISLRLGSAEFQRTSTWFYDKIVRMILQTQYIPDDPARSEMIDWGGKWEEVLEWFSELAVEMQKGGYESSAIPESQLREILNDLVPEDKIDGLVEAIRFRGVLLQERTEVFHFYHPVLRRYLLARKILKGKEKVLPDYEFLVTHPEWREIVLMVYQLALSEDKDFASYYLEWLTGLELPGIELAGSALLEANDLAEEKRRHIAGKLVEALSDKAGGALPPHRALAGNTLARLGDLRFDKESWFLPADPLLGFIKIPMGNYLIGANPQNDPAATSKESPMHELTIPAYYIACYPTTVAQFRIFVEETGYAVENKDWSKGPSNHPVVQVSWDNAMAYCRWLEKKLTHSSQSPEELSALLKTTDWELSLPSEPEWETAGRGTSRRAYPWGGKFDPRRTNTAETRLGTTTAAGIFAPGESQFHVLDLSGNVWEWTRSLYRIYFYTSDDGREDFRNRDDFRVLRGGSFLDDSQHARCSYRNVYYPYFRANNIGFRVALYQKYTYEEKEVEVEVPLGEGEVSPDGKNTRIEIQKIMERKRFVITGPKMNR